MGLEFWNSLQDFVSIVLVLVVGMFKSTMYLLYSVQSSYSCLICNCAFH